VRDGITVIVNVAVAVAGKDVDEGTSVIAVADAFDTVVEEQPADARTHMKETAHKILLRNIRNAHPAIFVSI